MRSTGIGRLSETLPPSPRLMLSRGRSRPRYWKAFQYGASGAEGNGRESSLSMANPSSRWASARHAATS